MILKYNYYLLFLTVFCLVNCTEDFVNEDDRDDSEHLFTSLPSSYTNINFRNQLDEGLNTNILMYEYFYNGGGVAIGDLNGDDALDIYFTSNMGSNKIYINSNQEVDGKISLIYTDVSTESMASGREGPWKTGVNMIDINGDQKLDIYLCYSGALPEAKRKNQLFINMGNNANGVPIFEEQAEEYGLASGAFSNQSYFLDYDKDGDLDMLLLNHNPKNLPLLSESKTRELLAQDDPLRGLRLYKQTNGKFNDVTIESGIQGSQLSYGLGLGISDFNNDGWPDFYVSNDYAVPDYLYINKQNGTFKNELENAMGHTSQFSMGNDISDINKDGLPDILTLDMLPEDNRRQKLLIAPDNYSKYDHNVRSGFHHQLMRNMLQLNNGNGTFSEIGQLSGISNTDWSWAALFADYDNDGNEDLFITNGYNRDYTNLDFINYMEDYVQSKGRLQREDVVDIIEKMPSSDLNNFIFQGDGNYKFEDKTNLWGFNDFANSNGAAYGDLDNDGDLDLVVNNINKEAFIYENQSNEKAGNKFVDISLEFEGLNLPGIGSKVILYTKNEKHIKELNPSRGYQSSVSPILHFGLGVSEDVDSIKVLWPNLTQQVINDIALNQKIKIKYNPENSDNWIPGKSSKTVFESTEPPLEYSHSVLPYRDFDRQQLLPFGISNNGPLIKVADINLDGLEDIFIGGALGKSAKLYLQNAKGTFRYIPNPDFEINMDSEDTDAIFFDADNDGLLDLYVASGGYHRLNPNDDVLIDRFYKNIGGGKFELIEDAIPTKKEPSGALSIDDINNDGFLDLFIGGKYLPGRFPESSLSYILINNGNGKFEDRTKEMAFPSERIHQVEDSKWVDLNGDNVKELLIAGKFSFVKVFSIENGKFKSLDEGSYLANLSGFWNKIATSDVNKDGKEDILLGNFGNNIQLQASKEYPIRLYANDYDGNGSMDPILTHYIDGVSYPFLTRDELLSQLVSLRSKFTTFESYANATTDEILKLLKRDQEETMTVDYLKSGAYISNNTGQYDFIPFPEEAQFSPIYTIDTLDYNDDGNLDILCFGNNDEMKLQLGKCDASYGILLRGKGDGLFEYIPQELSGLDIKGDVRSVVKIGNKFLIGVNGNAMKAKYLVDTN